MGKVIYAFPASGKTEFCKKYKNAIELSSEKYHWLDLKKESSESDKGLYCVENKEWPHNYYEAIQNAIRKYDYVFVTHSGSLICEKYGIPYELVYPKVECKNEYLGRMINRGNNLKIINNMSENFERYIEDCKQNIYATVKIELNHGEYLEDAIFKRNNSPIPIIDYFENDYFPLSASTNFNRFKNQTKKYIQNNNIKYAFITFNNSIISSLPNNQTIIGRFYSGSDYHEIISINNFLIVNAFVGGPNASGLMEELASYGIKYFLAIGSAGLINSDYESKNIFLVDRAIRDEGTSYQYLPASVYSYPSEYLTNLVADELANNNINYNKGTIWTTDAYYREGIKRINKRVDQGAICVDMECATWCAVAQALKLDFAQIVYFSDCVINKEWEKVNNKQQLQTNMTNFGINLSKKLVKKIRS